MEYNYVFFDCSAEYYCIARRDFEMLSNVKIRTGGLAKGGRIAQKAFQIHRNGRLNAKVTMPFQSIWNKKYVGELNFFENKPICFLFGCGTEQAWRMRLIPYLRKTYPDCRIALLIRDRIAILKRNNPHFNLESAKKTFDRIYTISAVEAEKFDLRLAPVMCSRHPVSVAENDLKSDVVFIGKAKDRTDTICRAYQKFTEAGLLCDFLLVGDAGLTDVPKGLSVSSGIVPYSEMLRRTVNARCVFEVTQKGIGSMTSRFLEALCYNKLLISDNQDLVNTKFYDPTYIQLFEDVEDIDVSFVKRDVTVDYGYKDEYSPIRLLEYIDRDLQSPG